MADVRAFRGIHYNGSLMKDLRAVICPPYDVISPEQQEELYAASEYNFIRLEHNRELPQDTDMDNKYTRARGVLEQWLSEGALEQDAWPAIYLHDHYFTYRNVSHRRRGIIASVRLEEWDKMIVRPHEGTLRAARGDRLNLLRALKANTSPVLAMYDGAEARMVPLLPGLEKETPLASYKDGDGNGHTIWAITDRETIAGISRAFEGQSVYIADGHHRYESALSYRNEQLETQGSLPWDAACNYVMMTLVDIGDPGLLVLPPHRLMRGIPKSTLAELEEGLSEFFSIEKLPLDGNETWKHIDSLMGDKNKLSITLFGLDMEHLLVLTLRHQELINRMMPSFHSELYRSLDVSVLDHVILENLLAHSHDIATDNLAYCYDRQDAIQRVQNQEYQLALFISPATPQLIKSVADTGEKMPRKSTYFYPKTPSGLVFHRLV